MAEAAAKLDYGLDAPVVVRSMVSRGAWTLAFGLALFLMNRTEYPGPATSLLAALGTLAAVFFAVAIVMVWSSRVAKLRLREQILDTLNLQGDEKVLDVGCGRGLLAVGAAKRLKTGRVTAIDAWDPRALSGNSADAAKENAKTEGVAEKVRVENGNALKLTYSAGHFDAVISSLAIHNIPDHDGRAQAVREMLRVLKPGGRLAIFDLLRTGEYAAVLRAEGAQDVALSKTSFLWCLPSRIVTARK
jgi:SAM-dependent methyltransferase